VQENGTQLAIQTIYRELDRARSQIKKHAKHDNDDTDEFEDDWTIVEDDEEAELPFEVQQPIAGMSRASIDASRAGSGALALGSMVLKASAKRNSESTERRG
jgi:sterol 3beta-glucosyltransferase